MTRDMILGSIKKKEVKKQQILIFNEPNDNE